MNQTVKFPLIDTILRIVVLFLLIAWCIGIILPFLEPVLGGAVIAVAARIISASSNAPVFGLFDTHLGDNGIVGGSLLDQRATIYGRSG